MKKTTRNSRAIRRRFNASLERIASQNELLGNDCCSCIKEMLGHIHSEAAELMDELDGDTSITTSIRSSIISMSSWTEIAAELATLYLESTETVID